MTNIYLACYLLLTSFVVNNYARTRQIFEFDELKNFRSMIISLSGFAYRVNQKVFAKAHKEPNP